jgi:hypothetical protein
MQLVTGGIPILMVGKMAINSAILIALKPSILKVAKKSIFDIVNKIPLLPIDREKLKTEVIDRKKVLDSIVSLLGINVIICLVTLIIGPSQIG